METARQAARAVIRFITAGLPQDAASLETIRATLGEDDTLRALARIKTDPETSEYAPLTALLFSPGPEALRALEPALAQADLDAPSAAALAEAVAGHFSQNRVPLLLPGGARVDFPAAKDDLRGFVRRLRPEATAPQELRTLLARRFSQELALTLVVLLRHSRLKWEPAQVFFLAALLERAAPASDNLPDLAAWVLRFLDTAGPALSPREALSRRRQALETQLRQAEAQELACSRGSFEVRMSQGLRLGHVHGPDVRAEQEFLDQACALVLGLPGEALGGKVVRDLGEIRDLPGLEALLRTGF